MLRQTRNLALNRAAYHSSSKDFDHTAHLATDGQASTLWLSQPGDPQWIYVDLGASCEINRVVLQWGEAYAAAYQIQVSEDALHWTTLYATERGPGGREELPISGFGRYVRMVGLRSGAQSGYALAEFQIYGAGPAASGLPPTPAPTPDGKLYLTGGNWKVQRAAFVGGRGEQIAAAGYAVEDWIPASVPGTVLTSYLNAGAVPDPNYRDQQFQISDWFFTSDFWYRDEFSLPAGYAGRRVWLNFAGINYRAEVYLNGAYLGRIDGAFIRGLFDCTTLARPGETNYLAVLVRQNDHPGAVKDKHLKDPGQNGGDLGYDGPTFLASIGWNWMPTIRGRNTGIWDAVFFSQSGPVTIVDPFVRTDLPLPDTSSADLTVQVGLHNHTPEPQTGVLKGAFGGVTFEQPVSLAGHERKTVTLDKSSHPQLSIAYPRLWWPNGYGEPHLYALHLAYEIDSAVSDTREISFGIRQFTYNTHGDNLKLAINGKPLVIRGGNWGMCESMLRCDPEGYDLRLRLHKEMNFNMVRNWIGMTAHQAFYDAADRYGILVWDDFWLANPVDGPEPLDHDLFLSNVRDKILRRRNHACLALWVGRNEGFPPPALDAGMRARVNELDGARAYLSNSAHSPVTGLGPYEIKDPNWYFQNRGTTLHSELGIVAVPPLESLLEMMAPADLWPVSPMWGKHDWTQERVDLYTEDIYRSYGPATGIADFCRKAQMMNMEGPKAQMETWRSRRGGGVLVWMSHPAWPSLICQTYDYYFEPSAAFFAYKNACEPLHVLWRSDNGLVQVANDSLHDLTGLSVEALIYNLDGAIRYRQVARVNAPALSTMDAFEIQYPPGLSDVHFIKLRLKEGATIRSENFYWRGTRYQDYTALADLPQVDLSVAAARWEQDDRTYIDADLMNCTFQVALMARLLVLRQSSNRRVLPIHYQDNYISLLPGESRRVRIEFPTQQLGGEAPWLFVEGWNILKKGISIPTRAYRSDPSLQEEPHAIRL